MRKYETVFISDPDLSEPSRAELQEKVRGIIGKENGILLDLDDWGNKKLAYEVRRKMRGHYFCTTYGGNGDLVTELERNFRLTDDVMKFMTIVLSEDVSKESIEKEAAEIAAGKETAAVTAPADDKAETADDSKADSAPAETEAKADAEPAEAADAPEKAETEEAPEAAAEEATEASEEKPADKEAEETPDTQG